MPGFSLRNAHMIIVGAILTVILGVVALLRMPVDVFPHLDIPVAVVATFYPGMPPLDIEADITTRFESVFYSRQRHRAHGITFAARREHYQGILSAWGGSQRCHIDAGESGDGRPAPSASGHFASTHSQVRCVSVAGNTRDRVGERVYRSPTSRPGSIQHSELDRDGSWYVGPATVRRQIPANHGVPQSQTRCKPAGLTLMDVVHALNSCESNHSGR